MGKINLKSRKRREQTIAIVIVAAVVLIITAVILLFAASNNSDLGSHDHDSEQEYENEAEVILRVGLSAVEGSIHYTAVEEFKDEVEERTEGIVRVEIYDSEKLGEDVKLIQSLEKKEDVVDIVVSSVENFTVVDERMDISSLPFMFDGYESAWAFMEGKIQQEIEEDLVDKNIRVLAHYSGGFEHITSTKTPISNMDNLKNLYFAMSEESYSAIAMRAMNARTVLLSEKAIYQALQSGECSGYIGSVESIYETKVYQIQDYMSFTYHNYNAYAFAISENVWDSLTEEQQKIIQTAAVNSAYTDREMVRQQEDKIIKDIESSGVRVLYPKLSSFSDGADAVIRGYRSKYGSLVDQLIQDKNN